MAASVMSPPSSDKGNNAGQVEMILSKVDSLPTLPAVATQLLELTGNDRTGVREVVGLVESDPSLASRVLSVVNRASTGCKADSVERAVALLGLDGIRSLVLSIQIFDTFHQRIESATSSFDRIGFWKHSLGVACAARLAVELEHAGRCDKSNLARVKPEDGFLCGLVHDIGKIVFDAVFPKTYDRVLSVVESARGCIADVERSVFGLDHSLVGRRLAAHWKLPAMIDEVIWLHPHLAESTPKKIKYPQHVRLVQFADRLVRHMRIGYSGNYQLEASIDELAKGLAFSPAIVEGVMQQLPDLIAERADLLGLEKTSSKELFAEALGKANAELARVNTSLSDTNRQLQSRARCFDALHCFNSQVGSEPTHEELARAAADAAGRLTEARPIVVFAWSANRGVVGFGTRDKGTSAPQVELATDDVIEGIGTVAQLGGRWSPVNMLPRAMADRVSALLNRTSAWWWPICHGDRLLGGIVVPGRTAPKSQESWTALADGIGAWLNGAESAAEARSLNEELAEMNRQLILSRSEATRMRSLAMVGEMAAGAAHELNNPLAIISGRAQLLQREDVSEAVLKAVELIADNTSRASQIVSELMDFAKPAPPAKTTWSLAEFLAQCRREWIEQSSLADEQIQIHLSDETRTIVADASQIRTLFDEVFANALDAMSGVASPLLSVNCRQNVADDKVVVEVADNGRGMTDDVAERAMTPFFSHRTAGRGRGMGLPRAARLAEVNGGCLSLSSTPGAGTVVLIELPLA